MKSFFEKFFYGVENTEPVIIPPIIRLAIVAVWIMGILLIVKKCERFARLKKPQRVVWIMAVILLIDQIILYAWQFGSGYFNVVKSLPLYHCRIAVPLLILDFVFNIKVLRKIWPYWAALGTIFAMIFMDLYHFDFPHFTNFQFFIIHIFLGWILTYLIFVLDYRFNQEDFKTVQIITFGYNVFLIIFNSICNRIFELPQGLTFNYGYLTYPPDEALRAFTETLPFHTYTVVMLIGYQLLILFLYLGGRLLNSLSEKNHLKYEKVKEHQNV